MRIGVNARFLINNRLEGIGWYSYHVLRNMIINHPEHEYFFFFDRKPDSSFIFNNSVIPVILFPQARHPFLWYWWFEYSIPRALKKYKIDLFFSPDGYASLSTSIPQYLVIHDLAFVHYPEHVPFLVRKYYQHFAPKQIAIVKHLFVVSNSVKQDLIKQYDIPENKITIAYNGVREEFKPLKVDEIQKVRDEYSNGKKYFLCVGAIHPRKNIANLILAFNQFKKYTSSDALLLIVGRKAWLTDETEAAYENSLYKDEIIFIPYCQTKELARITAAAFYAINPSLLEGFGVPVLEALCCDIPVMVSNQFSLPEVAGPGAIIFNPFEINDICKAMIIGLDDPEREQRIQLGRIHRQQFNWDSTAEIVYSEMIKNYNSGNI